MTHEDYLKLLDLACFLLEHGWHFRFADGVLTVWFPSAVYENEDRH